MSDLAKKARASAEEKAERLTRTPKGDVDASGWREPLGMDGGVQTGPRPVSRRAFRAGGKVTGSKAIMHAGRKPRASGGLTANSLINRNVKSANDEREGYKHIGGMAKGGRAHKFVGGPMMGRPGMPASEPMTGVAPGRQMPAQRLGMRAYADGGGVHGADCKCSKCSGGRVGRASGGGNWIAGAIKHPGALHKELHVKEGEKIPAKKLDKAEHSKNPKLARRAHLAETLKGLHKKGGGSVDGTRPTGDRIARAHGGKAKKGMNVNIVIAPQGGGGARPPMPMGAAPGPVGIPAPPPQMPPPGAAPPMGPPPMARKHGGRTNYPIDAGAGSGLGRLEKMRAYGART